MKVQLRDNDDPLPADSRSATAFLTLPDAMEIRLQQLLEQYTVLIEAGDDFDRSAWMRSACTENDDLSEELRAGAQQIDALAKLANGSWSESVRLPEIEGFQVVRQLGRGGTGVVYEAIERDLDRRVALKIIPGLWDKQTKSHARFVIEAQAAARLNHPHIVPVHRIGEGDRWGTTRFLVMQLIEGESLSCRLRRGLPDQRQVIRWLIDACEAISHAHQCGVIHRDVKPSNLLIDHSNRIMVTDFGLARLRTSLDHSAEHEPVTSTGDRIGTLAYMSPQQAAGEPVDERTDVYSLGLTLFEALTGRRGIEGETIEAIGRARQNLSSLSIRAVHRHLPHELDKIVCKATAIDLADRYRDATEMADDLKRFCEGRPVLATAPSVFRRLNKWLIKHRWLALSVTAGCILMTVVSWAVAARLAVANHQVQEALARSQSDLRRSEEILDRFGLLAADQLRQVEGAQAVRRELLETALEYYEQHARRIGDLPAFTQQNGIAHFKAA